MKQLSASLVILVLAPIILAQTPGPQPPAAPTSKQIALSKEDQAMLDGLTSELDKMKKNLAAVEKQRDDAQANMIRAQAEFGDAVAFINLFNQYLEMRKGFLNRIAADVCGCKTTEVELAPDGKSVVRSQPNP